MHVNGTAMTEKLKAGHIAASIASEHSYGDIQSARSGVFGHTTTHGKSSHVQAVRGLGLFHDLQEYVLSLEQTAESQRQQLGRLKEEKRDVEKELMRELRAPDKQPYVAHFQASEVADLPPRLRALFEDNKALKDKVRKYKSRTQELEQQLTLKERSAASLEQHVVQLKSQLQECSRSPAAVHAENALTQQLEEKNKEYQKLWQKQAILDQKLESDARGHKQALAAAAKERAALSKDIAALKQQLDDKDKEARAQRLEAKHALRKLEELRKASAAQLAATVAAVREEGAAEVRRVKAEADSGVHLMLCVIREELKTPRRRASVPEYQAPVAARQEYNSSKFCPEEAATKVQAAVRGHLTRKQLAQVREREQKAAVLIQAGARGLMARKQVQELKRQVAEAMPAQLEYAAGQGQQGEQGQQQEEGPRPSCLPMELPAASAGTSGRAAGSSAAKGVRQRSTSTNSFQQAKPARASAVVGHRRATSSSVAETSAGRPTGTVTTSAGRARNMSRLQLQAQPSAGASEKAAEQQPTAAEVQPGAPANPAGRPFRSGGSGSRSRHRASMA